MIRLSQLSSEETYVQLSRHVTSPPHRLFLHHICRPISSSIAFPPVYDEQEISGADFLRQSEDIERRLVAAGKRKRPDNDDDKDNVVPSGLAPSPVLSPGLGNLAVDKDESIQVLAVKSAASVRRNRKKESGEST